MPSFLPGRKMTHGDFDRVAECTQRMKEIWRAYPAWSRMTAAQKEGVEMISHKLCRALCGDPNHRDHWLDIAGYATRVAEETDRSCHEARDEAVIEWQQLTARDPGELDGRDTND
jgi:hypothetical protein